MLKNTNQKKIFKKRILHLTNVYISSNFLKIKRKKGFKIMISFAETKKNKTLFDALNLKKEEEENEH